MNYEPEQGMGEPGKRGARKGCLLALLLVGALLIAAVLLAGCSEGGQQEPLHGPPDPGYWPQEATPPPVVEVPLGQTFDYAAEYNDKPDRPVLWRGQLTKLECGIKSLPKAVENPKWQGEAEGEYPPQYLAAKAKPGKQFCLAYWAWENVGKEHGTPDPAGDIVLPGGERWPSVEMDSETFGMSDRVAENKWGHKAVQTDTNPREKAKSLDVYVIPDGVQPEAVWYPHENLMHPNSHILVKAR